MRSWTHILDLCTLHQIHWHGLSQRMTPASDGTPLISQWPIAPGRWFEYEMKLTKEDVSGRPDRTEREKID